MRTKIAVRSLLLIPVVALLLTPRPLAAQTKPQEWVATLGCALSYTGLSHKTGLFTGYNYYQTGSISNFMYPVLALSTDYGITDKVSIGACFSWEEMGYKFVNFTYTPQNSSLSYATPLPSSWTDTYDRHNFAVRGLYHVVGSEEFDVYLGVRAGYLWWTRKSTNADPYYNYANANKFNDLLIPVAIQSLFGVRYSFNSHLGINFEAGIGPPYAFMLGICNKF